MRNYISSALTSMVMCILSLVSFAGTGCVAETPSSCEYEPGTPNPPPDMCMVEDGNGRNRPYCNLTVPNEDNDCVSDADERTYCAESRREVAVKSPYIYPNASDPPNDGEDWDCDGRDAPRNCAIGDNCNGGNNSTSSSSSSGNTSSNGGGTCESHCSTSCVASQYACGADGNTYCNECVAACHGTSLTSCQGVEFTLKVRHKDDPWEAYGLVETPTVLQSTTCKEYTFTGTGNDQNAQLMFMVGKSTMPFRFSNVVFRQTNSSGNLARNGNFQNGTRDWVKEDHLGGMSFSASGGELLCQSGHDGGQDWQVACYTLVPVQTGMSYTLSFCARAG